MQLKSVTQHIKSISGRTVTGVFAVHGNVDSGNDRSWPGSFAKTFSERAGKIRFLWGHDFSSPPIATITGLRELGRDELPASVLATAPDAMGGAEVTREYLDTPRGNEVLAGLQSGAITEMSYAYDPVKFDFEELPGAKYEWEKIRNLREVRLYEVSDVLWGMNPATSAAGKSELAQPLEWMAALLEHLKAGARHSSSDTDLINQIAANAIALGATNVKLIEDSEQQDDSSKSRAEPVSLTPLAQRLRLLNLSVR